MVSCDARTRGAAKRNFRVKFHFQAPSRSIFLFASGVHTTFVSCILITRSNLIGISGIRCDTDQHQQGCHLARTPKPVSVSIDFSRQPSSAHTFFSAHHVGAPVSGRRRKESSRENEWKCRESAALRLDFPALISATCSGIHLPTERANVLLHGKSINPKDDSIDLFTLRRQTGKLHGNGSTRCYITPIAERSHSNRIFAQTIWSQTNW